MSPRSPRLAPAAAALGLLLGLAACGDGPLDEPDDDDATTDDDDTACGDPSDGAGGGPGATWLVPDGFGTPADEVPDHEMLVYVPADLDPTVAAPVLVLVGRRMPTTRAENEFALIDPAGLDIASLAEEMGWITALPLPRVAADGRLSWSDDAVDQEFFRASLDLLEANWQVDRDRVWLFGSSAGGIASVYLGWLHADRVASIFNHAGRNPFEGAWPSTPWGADCAAMFVHDEADTVVPRPPVEDGALMFEDAGQVVERVYDYSHGHQWRTDEMNALMADWFPRTCN